LQDQDGGLSNDGARLRGARRLLAVSAERLGSLSPRSAAGALALTAALLLGVWHFGGIPGEGPLRGPLHSAAHFPVFGLLGAITFVSLRRFAPLVWHAGWRAYAMTLLAMLVLSAVAEWSQQFTGRNASLRDVGVNMAGTVAVLCLIALYDRQVADLVPDVWRRVVLR
jgi:hypothetical protein